MEDHKIERSEWELELPSCCAFVAVTNNSKGRRAVTAHFGCGAKRVMVTTTVSSGERPEPRYCISFLSTKCAEHACGSGKRAADGGSAAEGMTAGKRGRNSFAEIAKTVGFMIYDLLYVHPVLLCSLCQCFIMPTLIACPRSGRLTTYSPKSKRSRFWRRSCGMCARPTRGLRAW